MFTLCIKAEFVASIHYNFNIKKVDDTSYAKILSSPPSDAMLIIDGNKLCLAVAPTITESGHNLVVVNGQTISGKWDRECVGAKLPDYVEFHYGILYEDYLRLQAISQKVSDYKVSGVCFLVDALLLRDVKRVNESLSNLGVDACCKGIFSKFAPRHQNGGMYDSWEGVLFELFKFEHPTLFPNSPDFRSIQIMSNKEFLEYIK